MKKGKINSFINNKFFILLIIMIIIIMIYKITSYLFNNIPL